jgi:hypothetical protein
MACFPSKWIATILKATAPGSRGSIMFPEIAALNIKMQPEWCFWLHLDVDVLDQTIILALIVERLEAMFLLRKD